MSSVVDPVIILPAASRGERNVPAASSAHCTACAVLGDGVGLRFQAESWLELCNLYILNAMDDVAEMREQVRFFYGKRGEQEHVFDLMTVLRSGTRIAYTVKPESRLMSGQFVADMQEIAWWVLKRDFADDVRLITEADIHPTDLVNARAFAATRGNDPEAEEVALEVVRLLPAHGGRTLRELTIETGMEARGYRALIRLLRRGILRALKHEMIGPAIMVASNDARLTIARMSPASSAHSSP